MSGKRRKLATKEHDVPAARDPSLPHHPSAIASLLASRETLGNKYGQTTHQRLYTTTFTRLPPLLRERQMVFPLIDKVFACLWLDANHVLIGTKDNSLLKINVDTLECTNIPRPDAPRRSFSSIVSGWGQCGIHCITVNPSRDLIATGGKDPADCVILRASDFSPVTTLIGHRDWLFGAAWVTDRHVVTGSRDKAMALWSIDADDGHGDEDPTVQEYDYTDPRVMKQKYEGKVRDVKYNAALGLLAGLGTDGAVKLHDPCSDLRIVRSLNVKSPRELVAMEMSDTLVAIGGSSRVTLFDPRKRLPAAHIGELLSPDAAQGIRSICLSGNLLSYGTGKGKIAFYDLRASKYLPLTQEVSQGTHTALQNSGQHHHQQFLDRLAPPQQQQQEQQQQQQAPPPASPTEAETFAQLLHVHLSDVDPHYIDEYVPPPTEYLQTGSGWVQQNSTFWEYFGGRTVQHACYAQAWDSSGTRLLACGGPLAFGLTGGYMALWE